MDGVKAEHAVHPVVAVDLDLRHRRPADKILKRSARGGRPVPVDARRLVESRHGHADPKLMSPAAHLAEVGRPPRPADPGPPLPEHDLRPTDPPAGNLRK